MLCTIKIPLGISIKDPSSEFGYISYNGNEKLFNFLKTKTLPELLCIRVAFDLVGRNSTDIEMINEFYSITTEMFDYILKVNKNYYRNVYELIKNQIYIFIIKRSEESNEEAQKLIAELCK